MNRDTSSTTRQQQRKCPTTSPQAVAFKTKLGWMGFTFQQNCLLRTRIGFSSRQEVECALQSPRATPQDQAAPWVQMFQRAAQGFQVDFSSLEIDLTWATDFQKRVIAACRTIPFRETLTYGQLARLAGSPNAARAVGTVMANNRYPLVVPCHRVVASNGIGGFSAPNGLCLKKKLLAAEGSILVN